MPHGGFAEKAGGHLLIEIAEDLFFDFVGDFLYLFGGDSPLVAGLLKTGDDFFPLVGHAGAVFLDHAEFVTFAYLFVGGKPPLAGQALTPTTNNPPAFT